jgi:hypothetical protein
LSTKFFGVMHFANRDDGAVGLRPRHYVVASRPSRLRALPRHSGSQGRIRLRQGYGATRSCAELERNVPFYQTNPFQFREVFVVSILYTETYAVCRSVCKWVRSGKTNPIWRVYRTVFNEEGVCSEAKQSHCGVATVTSFQRSGGPEVGIDNRRRRVSIRGAGDGTNNKARQS